MAGNGGPRAGAGRPKGVPNKVGAQVREAILEAFKAAGGVRYLITLSEEHPQVFAVLLGKILPTEVQHSGEIELVHSDDDRNVLERFMPQYQSGKTPASQKTLQ